MRSPAKLRRASAEGEDSDAIACVLRSAFEEFRPLYTVGGFDATTPSAETIRRRLLEGPTWLAFCEGEVAGTVSAALRANHVYLRSMAVMPRARGRGVGVALLQEVEQFAAAEGHTRIDLSTTPFLADAIRLYERFGFRRTEAPHHDLLGTPLFTMTKKIG
jgi:GNAT superfamily N-acetyltransferase